MIPLNSISKKYIFYTALALIVVLCAVLIILDRQGKPESADQIINEEVIPAPEFSMGTVTKIQGNKIYFDLGRQEAVAVVSDSTEFQKEAKTEYGTELVSATIKDIKKSSVIIVFYSKAEGVRYETTKVQIVK
jgi:hypothetical protein